MRAPSGPGARRRGQILALACAMLAAGLYLAPAANASGATGPVPAGFLGLPSLHGIIEAIASGFFGALAKALVPSWLTHGTVATIQSLVALPDPGQWPHVSALTGETTFLGAMLAPVTLSVATLRYWTVGLTGSAHPASALVRCAGATGLLVAYRWIVEQTVAATNTVTHGLLALPTVSGGLSRIIGVLFGGALLSGAGGVFGALLVIVGVVFAAGLFATQVLLTVVLAVLVVAGPPLIALSAIPELSHLARAWRDALLTVAVIPLAWTLLFATAGALCLDATSFTGGAGGLPSHVAAAFAGLITFALAVKLPLVLLGELRHVLARHGSVAPASSGTSGAHLPGATRVRTAHARLRAIGLQGVPALGSSVGRAAGAMGAPRGGPLGAARRGVWSPASTGRGGTHSHQPAAGEGKDTDRRGIRARARAAGAILARAPREAADASRAAARDAAPYPSGHGAGEQTQKQRDARPAGGPPPASAEAPPAPRPRGRGSKLTPPDGSRPPTGVRATPRPSAPAPHVPPSAERRHPTPPTPPRPREQDAHEPPGAGRPGAPPQPRPAPQTGPVKPSAPRAKGGRGSAAKGKTPREGVVRKRRRRT